MFGKRTGEFSLPIPLLHDLIINLTAKDLRSKDFAWTLSQVVNVLHGCAAVGGDPRVASVRIVRT